MLSNLCGDDTDSPESNLNGISKHGWNKLKKHLRNISQKPCCVYFNCGMLVYYKPVGSSSCEYFVPGINNKNDCRAYRVFKHFIEKMGEATTGDSDSSDVFKCEPKTVNGVAGCTVYSCGPCRSSSERHDAPGSYDLFDGVGGDLGDFVDYGLGSELPVALRCLSADERMSLAVLCMTDATFSAYSGPGYTHNQGGAILTPADFYGLAALLLTPDMLDDRNEQWMKAAISLLKEMNPLVAETLTYFEKEIRAQGTAKARKFNFDAGAGVVALPMKHRSLDLIIQSVLMPSTH